MSTKITITTDKIQTVEGLAKLTGKPYKLRIQRGFLHEIDADGVMGEFPTKFEFLLDNEAPPYPRGEYQLSPNALYIGRDGKLSVSTRLIPFKPAAAVPASKV